jgi:hypothetical protein
MRFSGVALAALLAACQAAPAVSPEATSSPTTATASADRPTPSAAADQAAPTGSAEPTATAASIPATPTPKPSGYPTPNTFAFAVTDNLRVRTKPGVGDDSIKLEPLLWDGALVFVLDGPVAADGYDWFLVSPMGEADLQYHPDPPGLGWVAAAGKDGEPWLAVASFGCEPTPFDTLSDFDYPPHGLVGLACFRNTPFQFEAALVPGSGDCDTSLEPAWLDPCHHGGRALANPARVEGDERRLTAVFDPAVGDAVPAFDSEAVVNVTGQFDHPAAQTCRLEPDPDNPPHELVVLACRAQFVVTSIR